MDILFAFSPFVVFALVERFVGAMPGLIAGAIVSGALLVRSLFVDQRSIKLLEIGTFVLFFGLAVYAAFSRSTWPIAGVRLRVDAGLLFIVLVSILIRRPFTLQYARKQTLPEIWTDPAFVRTNYIITSVWAAAFAIMVVADLIMLHGSAVPLRVGIIVTIAAIYGAYRFTVWYPKRHRKTV